MVDIKDLVKGTSYKGQICLNDCTVAILERKGKIESAWIDIVRIIKYVKDNIVYGEITEWIEELGIGSRQMVYRWIATLDRFDKENVIPELLIELGRGKMIELRRLPDTIAIEEVVEKHNLADPEITTKEVAAVVSSYIEPKNVSHETKRPKVGEASITEDKQVPIVASVSSEESDLEKENERLREALSESFSKVWKCGIDKIDPVNLQYYPDMVNCIKVCLAMLQSEGIVKSDLTWIELIEYTKKASKGEL